MCLVGWLVFNGTFTAQEIQEINPITYLLKTDGRTRMQKYGS